MRRRFVLMPLLFAGVGLSTLLAGCQADVEAEIQVSDILDRETRGLFATSRVDTADCDRDSRSADREGSAGWSTWVLSGVFPDTRYRSCRETDSGPETTFRNMFVFDAMPGKALSGLSHVNIKLHEQTLSIGLPPYVQENIERVRQQVGNRSEPSIRTSLVLTNDSDAPLDYRVAEAIEGDEIRFGPPVRLEAGRRTRVELSEAFAARVLEQGRATVLRFEDAAR